MLCKDMLPWRDYFTSCPCIFISKAGHLKNQLILFLFLFCALLAGFAAVLSKENAAMLPVSILLFDLFLIQGVTKENIKKLSRFRFAFFADFNYRIYLYRRFFQCFRFP
jgi:hypothetical protein